MASTSALAVSRGTTFVATHGRLVDRRMLETALHGASWKHACAAIRAYQNEDGGFGHALEPDVRAPTSQTIFIHFALTALRESGVPGGAVRDVTAAACTWLAGIADDQGRVPYIQPDALDTPLAAHWNGPFGLAPSLHATAAVAAGLHALGAKHAWLDRATAWCVSAIEGRPTYSGHRMLNVLDLLEHLPDRDLGLALWDQSAARLFEADYVQVETPIATYGLTPLHFAPTPGAKSRALFGDDVLAAHLDDLLARQAEDGGWPIFWRPPPGAAEDEWRANWTMQALRTLRAYGRV